jgi:hypothetical protein
MHAFEFTLVVMDHVGILVLLDAEHCVGVGGLRPLYPKPSVLV